MKKCDICIVGAGTAGMAAAYALMGSNYKVIIVEKSSNPGGTAVNAWVETWIPGINPPFLKEILKKISIIQMKLLKIRSYLRNLPEKARKDVAYIFLPKNYVTFI